MSQEIPAGLFDPVEVMGADVLNTLSKLCDSQLQLEKEIEEIEAQLKIKRVELEAVSRVHIPTILYKSGLSELRLANGLKVVVEDKIKASVANKNYLLAYRNMVQAEGGDEQAELKVDSLFKSKIVVDYADYIVELLLSKDIPYDSTRSIHAQTLKKYCKDKLGTGEIIPEGITVFQYQETKIKE